MYTKTLGLVLRETEYKDADKLLTVLTKDRGKLTFRARGVRSRSSRLKSGCQLLAYSEFTVFENKEPLKLEFEVKAFKTVEKARLRMIVKSPELVPIGAFTSDEVINVTEGENYKLEAEFDLSNLVKGKYIASFLIFYEKDGVIEEYDSVSDVFFFEIQESKGDLPWNSHWLGNIRMNISNVKIERV